MGLAGAAPAGPALADLGGVVHPGGVGRQAPLAFDNQSILEEQHVELLVIDAGQLGQHDQLSSGLDDVAGRPPGGLAQADAGRLALPGVCERTWPARPP